ncbi:hypothetical protein HDU98_011256 [Podochytrium sp. JEL0797]|nr:hypothetical protein HDU98_011256 [Podochytrium sp. JEL0797]
MSGGADQRIRVWDLEKGTVLATLVCHARSVKMFVPVPLGAGMKMKHGIISVAEDASIAVIDLDSFKSVYILTGHCHDVYALHWRALEETMVVQCSNFEGSVYVWQLKTGHLDRVEEGDTAAEIISCCDCSLVLGDYGQDYANVNTKQTFAAFPVAAGFNRTPILFILLVNLKRFINDVYGGQYSITPPSTPPQSRKSEKDLTPVKKPTSSSDPTATHDSVSTSPTKGLTVPAMFKTPSRSGKMGSGPPSPTMTTRSDRSTTLVASKRPSAVEVAPVSPAVAAAGGAGVVVAPTPRVFGDRDLVRGVLSASLSWGVESEVDRVCKAVFGLCETVGDVAVGNRGANGFISVPIPRTGEAGVEWSLSPTMSASRMLQIVSLLRTITVKKEYEKDVLAIISKFCSLAASTVSPHFQPPSFSFLAKYWQDQISDVQQAARTIFSATLGNLSDAERMEVIDYWRGFLPSVVAPKQKALKSNMRAAVIMGIIGCEDPKLLPARLCRDVAESLDTLLKEDIRSPHRMMAVELLGRGFQTWEPHVNAANVLRSIITTTGLQAPSAPAAASSSPATPSKDAATHAVAMASGPGSTPSPALVMVSRQAVVQIASVNPGLFISTLTFDFVHSKNVAERVGGLKLLGMFIAKKPMLLYVHIPLIIESMVKSLDPNVPGVREAVQTVVTSNFAELVKNFPCVAFHHGSQKLAVGTMDGLTVVYDLKTATKVQVLEGHTKPVTAVAFSSDGKLSVTFSFEENCVRFWQLSSGFLNSLVGAFGGGNSPGAVSKAGHMKNFREFSVGPAQKPNSVANFQVRFEWLGERSVKLHSIDGIEFSFSV